MRLMTLNIRHGSGGGSLEKPGYDLPSSRDTLTAIAGAIRAVDPDLVALQEVRNQLQAENLARLAGMKSMYVSHPIGYRLFFFEWGLAVLHRLRLLGTGSRPLLIDRASGVGRNCLWCRVDVDGEVVTVVNVHFAHEQKGTQMEQVQRLLEEVSPPVCVIGDFNSVPDDPLFSGLKARLADTCDLARTELSKQAKIRGTLVNGNLRGDSIWVDPSRFSVREAGLVAEPYRGISDHIGCFAEVTLK